MNKRSESPLHFSGIGFRYEGEPVLNGFELEVRAGEVTILTAPNGAGKTTTLWLAAGLLEPDQGQVKVFGASPFRERSILERVGFLAEGGPLPLTWTGREVLDFQRGTFARFDETECARLVERFGLDLKARVKRLSKGERGKLALTAVLALRPDLLLLDEPTLGLDVAVRRVLASEILSRLAEDGCAVVLASHEIAEAERTADRFVFIDGGRVACDEVVSDMLERHRLVAWDKGTPEPPGELDLVRLDDRLEHRALARHWDEEVGAAWVARGGRVAPADLETLYLVLAGEQRYV